MAVSCPSVYCLRRGTYLLPAIVEDAFLLILYRMYGIAMGNKLLTELL
jgi:hypothetical protein